MYSTSFTEPAGHLSTGPSFAADSPGGGSASKSEHLRRPVSLDFEPARTFAGRERLMGFDTHEISNQFDELSDYNLFATDTPLREALAQAGAQSFAPRLAHYGDTL